MLRPGKWIPPKYNIEKWETLLNFELRANKDNQGNGEKKISSTQLLSAAIRYSPVPNLLVAVNGNNLLNETYYNSADRKSAFAKERSFGINVSWQLY